MNYRILLILFLFMLGQGAAAEVSVKTDRDDLVVNESFQLIFESNEQVNVQPDFSPLNQFVTIVSRSSRTSTQIINGSVKYLQQWILVVLPKSPGEIQIPSILFGNEFTKPLTINVQPRPQGAANNQNEDIFLEVEVNTTEPYVQAEVVYTVKLYRAIPTSDSNLTEPKINGSRAVITQLESDTTYEKVVNGKRYGVFERQYAIFPQSSGLLTIEPIIFQGRTGTGGGFKLFDYDGPKQQVTVKQSETIQLDVKPIPADNKGKSWLPAENVTIQEEWSIPPDELKQGEVATRTLVLRAEGMVASNLPVINKSLPNGLKQYPDQPELEEIKNQDGFTALRREKMAVIPTKSGSFTLPAIQIQWWNTLEDRLEVAELPERIIQVAPTVTDDARSPADNNTESSGSTDGVAQQVSPGSLVSDGTWFRVSIVLLILWLGTLFAWYRSRHKSRRITSDAKQMTTRRLQQAVVIAAKRDDAAATKSALLAWANAQWPDQRFNNIVQLAPYVDASLQEELVALNGFLYGKQADSWQGDRFQQCFLAQSFKEEVAGTGHGELEPLYKS